MAFNPTRAQKAAIEAKGNVLVSAAAGSGKTAVLTERVASHIADLENPISADRILVVTFTKAAAAEMRSRIEAKLNERLQQNPDNMHLIRQMLLFPSAKICTIDSFCIELVRENFDKLGVNPDFKIVEENALNTIKNQAITEIFEEQFASKNAEFLRLLRVVGSRYDDSTLASYIRKIQEFTSKLPNPNEWLKTAAEQSNFELNGEKWRDLAFETAAQQIKLVIEKSNTALELLEQFPQFEDTFKPLFLEPKIYAQQFLRDIADKNWNALYFGVSSAAFTRMSNKKIPDDCHGIVIGKRLRKECIEIIKKLNDTFFDLWENIAENNKMLYPLIKKLVELVISYNKLINKKLDERNILTFYRTEQLAFQLLCRYENGELKVNDFAKEYINSFDEILVDEYQDTNPLQDMLFCVLSNNEERLFLVGDVKQSIYGFRGANPSNFLDKKKRYVPFDNQEAAVSKKIILGNNFRSRSEICDFINFFFSAFMTKENGEIDYGDEERLYPEAKFPEALISPVEVGIIENESESAAEAEADYIADSIIKTMNGGKCIRDEDNPSELRHARFSDFAVLLRATSKNAPLYAAQLEKRGIPVCLGADLFFKSREVQFILSLLSVVDNPTKEVNLATVLLSGFFGFTADDLALIKANDKYKNLYAGVISAADAGNEKCARCVHKLMQYRRKFTTMKISDFIDYVYEDLGLLSAVCCLENGIKRRDNLLLILEFAGVYEENEGKSVTGFLKFLEGIDENKLKSGFEADENSVKIISIHHSKGLQFPVCYFAGCSEKFNTSDFSSYLLLDEELYFSFKFFDPQSKRKLSTIQRQILISKARQKQLEEELRLAYVAMTRAQDKLVLLISGEKLKEKIKEISVVLYSKGNTVDGEIFKNAVCYTDWFLPAVLTHYSSNELKTISGADGLLDKMPNPFKINFVFSNDIFKSDIKHVECEKAKLNKEQINCAADKLLDNLKFVYPYEEILGIASKASVSQLAHAAEKDTYAFKTTPNFVSKGGISAAQRGTFTHRVMQFLDFKKAQTSLNDELDRLVEWQFFSEDDINLVDREKVSKFLSSELCKRIIASNFIRKEMRFLTERPASEISPELSSKFADENIVIQGAVDCLFEENGEIVVVDFKTDRVSSEKLLADTYREQLKIYAGACEKIFSKPVKEILLYSFHLGKEIKL
ncbi:MAG: helicase-exonuclease AddAB subunit AddA [Ruminococcaceae bacterium]|nr:helicase-exonuclease AddAB subunit AddA [Oscillospiraceae bacterium]